MLLLFIILLIIFIPEVLICFSPVKVSGLKKRITLNVYSEDTDYEKPIELYQEDNAKRYTIDNECESYLQIRDKKVFICNP